MEVGLLWYDDDPRRGLEDKIGRAALRYRERMGHWPNTCFVHPEALDEKSELCIAYPVNHSARSIRVLPAGNVLLHHLWLGKGKPPDDTSTAH
jgi:hypothetical protein